MPIVINGNTLTLTITITASIIIALSSLAQLAERAAVNR